MYNIVIRHFHTLLSNYPDKSKYPSDTINIDFSSLSMHTFIYCYKNSLLELCLQHLNCFHSYASIFVRFMAFFFISLWFLCEFFSLLSVIPYHCGQKRDLVWFQSAETCFVTYHMVCFEECSICTWEDCVFCYWMDCSTYVC